MRKLGAVVAFVCLGAAGAVLWWKKVPDSAVNAGPTTNGTASASPAPSDRLARGKYLFEHGSACIFCHSEHDTGFWGWPVKNGTEGAGQCFDGPTFGFPMTLCAPNLTNAPEGLGRWSDQQIITAIREGVDPKGRLLNPMMPYDAFNRMSDEDVTAIVAYLRSLPPSSKTYPLPPPEASPPEPIVPRLTGPVPPVPPGSPGYGEYVTTIGLCAHCHHSQEQPPKPFGGGGDFPGPAGVEYAANLTSHPTGVTGRLSRQQFVELFAAWGAIPPTPTTGGPQKAIMPRLVFAGLAKGDLEAAYDFIKSQPPVETVARPGSTGQMPADAGIPK